MLFHCFVRSSLPCFLTFCRSGIPTSCYILKCFLLLVALVLTLLLYNHWPEPEPVLVELQDPEPRDLEPVEPTTRAPPPEGVPVARPSTAPRGHYRGRRAWQERRGWTRVDLSCWCCRRRFGFNYPAFVEDDLELLVTIQPSWRMTLSCWCCRRSFGFKFVIWF